jgi:poly-gamma-glutamate capsule biosynthesis protein CapA/YwtB (metallophosphatase superfamily)
MEQINLLFTGDFCPHLRVEELLLNGSHELIFNDLKTEFDNCDWSIVDLECPLVLSGKKIQKTGPHLSGHPAAVNALKYLRVGAVAMANNHIMDYGADGLRQTIEICKKNNIDTIGVGANLAEARTPLRKTIKGRRLAFVNITENEWSNARVDGPGANPLDLVNNFRDIQLAKADSDFVIVIFHGGNERYEFPSPRLKETLRFFVEAGASAIITHHSHAATGFEVYREAPIFYGLGNFCFDWPGERNTPWNIGYSVRLLLGEKVSFEIIPLRQNSDIPGVSKLSAAESQAFFTKLKEINSIIANDEALQKEFDRFCESKGFIYNIYLEPYRNKWLAALRKRKLIPSLFSPNKKRLILNITRCEAHRDVLIKYLEK